MRKIMPILLIVGAVVGLVVLSGAFFFPQTLFQSTVTATVTNTDNVCRGTKCQYLVFTDKGTFKNTDNWMAAKFNSSDVQGRLVRGQTYTMRVGGYRFPLFSTYQNVLRVEDAAPAQSTLCIALRDQDRLTPFPAALKAKINAAC
jgi:hypothetical protein